jgi:hypothetical protein
VERAAGLGGEACTRTRHVIARFGRVYADSSRGLRECIMAPVFVCLALRRYMATYMLTYPALPCPAVGRGVHMGVMHVCAAVERARCGSACGRVRLLV